MRAILFDVFGTLVDWRSSLIEQFQALERELGGTLPCVELTDRWRQQYKPAMDRVRNGQAPWQHLDQLHRQSLEALAGEFGLALDEALLQRITGFWHRLRPWPDTLAGMHALKADYWLAALSNGNTALMLDVARHAGLPWDMLLCADLFGHYKPDPQVYLGACRLLDLPPQEVMLCAAHNYDLKAARALGLKTAFIARPLEYGPGQSQDLAAEQVELYLTWGEPPAAVAEKIAQVREKAARQGRQVRFGIRLHVIVRETSEEAWQAADRLIAHLDDDTIARAQASLARFDSVGQQRMAALHGGSRDNLEVSPNLWAGVGLVRGGAGTALVGDGPTVAARVREYAELGIDTFIFSGYPHLEESYRVAELLFPHLDVQRPAQPEGRGYVSPFGEMVANDILPRQAAQS